MKPHEKTARVADLMRRLKNAKQRALYASANPSFTGKRVSPRTRRGSELYEIALCDIRRLSDIIESITGKRPKPYDPQGEFRANFAKIIWR